MMMIIFNCITRVDFFRLVLFLRSVKQIQEKEATQRWSITFTEHQAAITKTCGLLFLVQISCWTPWAVLCLWTIILPPETLNIYYTLLPAICCKVTVNQYSRQISIIIDF